MNITINPFQQLFFSDDRQTEESFVHLFSDEVLQTAIHPVFQGDGNVVLMGTQGCGKTMVLTLLRPEIRVAYAELGRAEQFPVPEQMRNFVSAGINLTRSGVADIAHITLGKEDETDIRELPYYFADFLNYLVVQDLIQSVKTIAGNLDVFDSILDVSKMSCFVQLVTEQDCWFGALDGVETIQDLQTRISNRINFYHRWMNGNLPSGEHSETIRQSKTQIGEPIVRTAQCLRESGLIGDENPVLIRVDQIEELHRSFTERQQILFLAFRKMLNRMFAARDARVCYCVGSRRYGWENEEFLGIWGSEGRLERRRDYQLVDMDRELFQRGESVKDIFQPFAIDAFQKRVAYYFRHEPEIKRLPLDLAKSVFGKHPRANERIAQLNKKPDDIQIDRALALDVAADEGNWTDEWRDFLRKLYRSGSEGMLDAVLAAAWGRQTGGAHFKQQHRELSPPENTPWKDRKWWRKERLNQAVLQLSVRNRQRFMWWGFGNVLTLSGGNITVYLHICHRIWDGFLKHESSLPEKKRTDILRGASISHHIQAAGILFASNEWFRKLTEEPGGNSRQSFVERLGTKLNEKMLNDLRMAYPGGNGISFALSEFEAEDERVVPLRDFIREAVGYGALHDKEHSSKSKTGGLRIKFYLNPILCPRFQIPEARTKEPYYWSMNELASLIGKAKVNLFRTSRAQKDISEEQPQLPGLEGFER